MEVGGVADLPGHVRLELAGGVTPLDPKSAMVEAMLAGWVRQQRSRFLSWEGTIKPRVALVRRLLDFTNAYPWEWRADDGEAFLAHLRSPHRRKPIEMSTTRGYTVTLALFMDFVTDQRYGWPEECLRQFGEVPQQIFHDDTRISHVVPYEGRPGRRPCTYDEVQKLFDAADALVDEARSRGRKGTLTALRDAALLKVIYAYGLRRNETRMLDMADRRRNPKLPQFGRYGGLFVRYGKASRGSPPKRRVVLTVPEMDWVVEVLDHYVTEVRPALCATALPALFVTERAARMSRRGLNATLVRVRNYAGLPVELDLHSLRHILPALCMCCDSWCVGW